MNDDVDAVTAAPQPGAMPQFVSPIVPKGTIAGRALVAIVAIMTFLASLTTGAVVLVRAAASDWQSEVAREVTIQVRPVGNRDLEADVSRAADIARRFPGVADVRVYSKEESSHLLEPWLGTGLVLDELPVPRLAVVRIASGAAPEFSRLTKLLAEQVPSAGLDDHRGFVEHMRSMGRAAFLGGLAVLALVLVATVLSVTFATRGAIATNRTVVEVLHLIGAKNTFIAQHFQRRFLGLGLQGGAIGGGSAPTVRAGRVRKPPFPRQCCGRAVRGSVRELFDRHLGLFGGGPPDRPDRRRYRARLAPHRQPHLGNL
jgi:cell division transport system permease protein